MLSRIDVGFIVADFVEALGFSGDEVRGIAVDSGTVRLLFKESESNRSAIRDVVFAYDYPKGA